MFSHTLKFLTVRAGLIRRGVGIFLKNPKMGRWGGHNRLKCLDFPKLCLNWGGSAIVGGGGGVGNSNSTNYLHIRFERDGKELFVNCQ